MIAFKCRGHVFRSMGTVGRKSMRMFMSLVSIFEGQ